MLNVLFINPPNDPFSSSGILIEPIDSIQLASYIKSIGYHVSFIDMDVKKLSVSDIETIISKNNFDVVISIFDYHIPLHDVGTNLKVSQIFNISKKYNCKSILCGKAATFYEEEKLSTLNADYYVSFDAEKPLVELLGYLSNNSFDLEKINNIRYFVDNKLISNIIAKEKPNLDLIPIPDRDLIDIDDYIDVRTILSSRGCNLKCTFCHVPGFWGSWIYKSSQLVVDEINYLKNKFNSKKILFLDDNAIAQPKRMLEISNLLISNNNSVSLGCLGTIIAFDKPIFEKMYQAGFRWIHYGAESGDDYQLSLMKKKVSSLKIKETIQATQDIGFRVRTSWIIDMPGSTIDSIKNTEDLILEQNSEEIRLHFLTLRLGSSLFSDTLIETPQFIHNSKQNLNISGVDSQLISDSLNRIILGLKKKGYTLVINPDDFIDLEKLRQNNPKLKIVSLCPLRYGLNWNDK